MCSCTLKYTQICLEHSTKLTQVQLSGWLYTEMAHFPQTVTHKSSNKTHHQTRYTKRATLQTYCILYAAINTTKLQYNAVISQLSIFTSGVMAGEQG